MPRFRVGDSGRCVGATLLLMTLTLAAGLGCLVKPASGFTPQSKQVRSMIERSLAYLAEAADHRWGGKCLIGLVFLKEREYGHPKVQEALAECQRVAQKRIEDIAANEDIYSIGLGVMFLCELDSDLYRGEIEKLLGALWRRQLPHGGWGYPGQDVGDSSMTQYAVLAQWTAHRSGIEIRKQSVLDVCNWFLRTQDIKGGFGYHPTVPEQGASTRLSQPEVRESTSVAGLGSLYACSILLGANPLVLRSTETSRVLPAALVPVPKRGEAALDGAVGRSLAAEIKRAVSDGNKWYSTNFTISPKDYRFYYLYGLERYHAFREFAEGKQPEKEPGWYNQGVMLLAAQQQADGRWSSGVLDSIEDPINTAFAVLFLMRSTQRAIETSPQGDGLLIGGHGLPDDTRRIRMVEGRVVSQYEQRSAAAIARILSDPSSPDFKQLAELEGNLIVESKVASAQDQEQLRQIVVAGTPAARVLAIRALAKQGNLDNAFVLIQALSSDNLQVAEAAHEALCRISRKVDRVAWPPEADPQRRMALIDEWRQWYQSIRPDTKFVDRP